MQEFIWMYYYQFLISKVRIYSNYVFSAFCYLTIIKLMLLVSLITKIKRKIIINKIMSDKFEFKKQKNFQLITSPYQFKKKPSLLQYKQVIIELNDAVNSLSQENDSLKISVGLITQKNKQLLADVKIKQKRIQELQAYQKANDEQLTQQNDIIQQLKVYLGDYQNKISEMSAKIKKYEQKFDFQMEKRKKAQKVTETYQQKVRILEDSLESALEQNRNIRQEMIENSKHHEQQAYQLKQFSNSLKKKFEAFQFSMPVFLQPENNYIDRFSFLNPEQKIFQTKQRKSFSTQKKTRRNIGHLSTTNVIKNPKIRQHQNQPFRQQPIKSFQITPPIPEISHQLQNIKKQIANQYTLINLKQESYSKQRVTKTLEALQNIKRKAGKVVMQALNTGSQSQNQIIRQY